MRQLMKDYGKHILAVLGVVLMLTFALPSLFNNKPDVSSIPRGTLNGKTITQGQINVAARDLQVLKTFRLLGPLRILAQVSSTEGVVMPLDDRSEDTANIHWYLQLTEAEKYGLYVSEGEIDQIIREAGLSESDIRTNLDALQLSDAEFRSALRDALLIHKLGNLGMAAVQVSVPEMEQTADGFLSHVQFNYALLPDTGALDKIPDPSAAQIQKQFDLYKNVEPLASLGADAVAPTIDGHTYPFGYKYPNRLQLEWLKFDYAKVRAQFKPTRDDVEQAYKYYKDHPEEFTSAPASQPASQPATQSATQTASAPASQPATRTASTAPAIKSFDEVRDQLVDAQLKDRATKLLHRMVDRAVAQAAEPWKTAMTTAQGFREPVPAKDWVSYEKIADGIQTTREFNGYKPDYSHTDPNTWDARPDLQKIPGIGGSSYRTAHDNIAFPDLALDVEELVDPSKSPITTRLSLQVGVEGPVLSDADGNLYVYRVTAADPAHEPKTLDEVRARVIDDLKHLALYQQHQQQAKDLAQKASHAKADDLLTLAKAQGLTADTSIAISRMEAATADTPLTKVPGLVDAVFDLTNKSPATQPASRPATASAPASAPATAPSSSSVTTTLNDDAHLTVYVLNLHQYQPVTSLLFSVYRGQLFLQSELEAAQRFLYQWAGLDAIAKRLNYIPREPFPARKEST